MTITADTIELYFVATDLGEATDADLEAFIPALDALLEETYPEASVNVRRGVGGDQVYAARAEETDALREEIDALCEKFILGGEWYPNA